MKEKLYRALKWSAYPAFYFFCLLLFGYLTFPIDRLKDRILSEIAKQSKGKASPVITIEELDSYWLTGVEVSGVKIRLPPDQSSPAAAAKGLGSMGGYGMSAGAQKPEPEKESVIVVPEAHARARLLPLLIGRVQLDFWANVFGGEVSGTAPAGGAKGDVELSLSELSLSEVSPLQNLLGIPIDGRVNGELSLSPVDGKFNKASGKLDLSIKGLTVSDGKTKIMGLIAIPTAKVDEIVIQGEAEKGVLKITKLHAGGPDIELEGDGKIAVREPWAESGADLYVKFRFTDAYRGKDATTKSFLGDPASSAPGLIDMQVAKLKKAKRSDGFYGFHVHGRLKNLQFTPSATEVSGSGGRRGGKGADSPAATPGGKKVGGVSLPLGMSSARESARAKGKERAAEAEKKEEAEEDKKEAEEEKKDEAQEEKSEDRGSPGRGTMPRLPMLTPRSAGRDEPPVIAAPPEPGDPPAGEGGPEERPEEPR